MLKVALARMGRSRAGPRLGQVSKRRRSGVAALELAVTVPILMLLVSNLYDFGAYIVDRMQVANAGQIGAQAVWQTCDPSQQPATTQCPNMMSALTSAVQSTSLGNNVSLAPGSPTEAYYCINSSGVLQFMGNSSSRPADCSGAGMASAQPGDYITVQVSYTYSAQFPLSLASTLPTPIVMTSTVRID
jgi:Flp pilus assembly protein TadG